MTQIFNKLFLLAIMLTFGNAMLSAQQVTSQYLTVQFTPNGDSNKQTTKYTDADAEKFDIAAYINDNISNGAIQINGRVSTDLEYTRISFDSKRIADAANSTFCESSTTDVKPFIGIASTGMDDFSGVLLERVIEDSAADQYDLATGDVISYIDDYEIRSSCDLLQAVSKLTVGQEIEVTYDRVTPTDKKNIIVGSRKNTVRTWTVCAEQVTPDLQIATIAADVLEHNLDIFPNPSNGISTITFENASQGLLNIEILDLSGKRIYQQGKIEFNNYFEEEINISNQPSGIYIIELELNGKKYTKELVVAQK